MKNKEPNVILSEPQSVVWNWLESNNGVEEVFFGGSAGPGKSWVGCFWQIYRRLRHAGTRGFLGRKVLKVLKQTTLNTFWEVATDIFNLQADVDFRYREQAGEIHFTNGSIIFLLELAKSPKDPKYKKFGSYELTDGFIDEVTEVPEMALIILSTRLRFKLINNCKKMLCAGNPANNWCKWRWISNKTNSTIQLEDWQRVKLALLESNPNKEFVATYGSNLDQLPTKERMRLKGGNWNVIDNDEPFFDEFKVEKHVVGNLEFDPDYELLLSYDFNYDPASCLEIQMRDDGIYVLREYSQKGGTLALLQRQEHLKEITAKEITGDNSGHKSSSSSGSNSDFTQIEEFFDMGVSRLTYKANSRHIHSRKICRGVMHLLPFYISEQGCPQLIQEIISAKPKPDGGLLKDDGENRNDLVDAFRYGMNYYFSNYQDIVDYRDQIKALEFAKLPNDPNNLES